MRFDHARSGELLCVGFAAESQDLLAHAQAKLERKGVPLIVGNIGPAAFGRAIALYGANTTFPSCRS